MSARTADPQELFERWFIVPLRQLEQIPYGDGGIVAFSAALYLYERYAKSIADATGRKADDAGLYGQLVADFGFATADDAELFWNVARNGFLHQGMGLAKQHGAALPPWLMNGAFRPAVSFQDIRGARILCIQPWHFRDRVLSLFRERPDLIAHSKSFPWASISLTEQAAATPDMNSNKVIYVLLRAAVLLALPLIYLVLTPRVQTPLSASQWLMFGGLALPVVLAAILPIIIHRVPRACGLPPERVSASGLRFTLALVGVLCPLAYFAQTAFGAFGSLIILLAPIACIIRFQRRSQADPR